MQSKTLVQCTLKLVNSKSFFIGFDSYNDKLHLVDKELNGGYMVRNYLAVVTYQVFEIETDNIKVLTNFAEKKLRSIIESDFLISKIKVVRTLSTEIIKGSYKNY